MRTKTTMRRIWSEKSRRKKHDLIRYSTALEHTEIRTVMLKRFLTIYLFLLKNISFCYKSHGHSPKRNIVGEGMFVFHNHDYMKNV